MQVPLPARHTVGIGGSPHGTDELIVARSDPSCRPDHRHGCTHIQMTHGLAIGDVNVRPGGVRSL